MRGAASRMSSCERMAAMSACANRCCSDLRALALALAAQRTRRAVRAVPRQRASFLPRRERDGGRRTAGRPCGTTRARADSLCSAATAKDGAAPAPMRPRQSRQQTRPHRCANNSAAAVQSDVASASMTSHPSRMPSLEHSIVQSRRHETSMTRTGAAQTSRTCLCRTCRPASKSPADRPTFVARHSPGVAVARTTPRVALPGRGHQAVRTHCSATGM